VQLKKGEAASGLQTPFTTPTQTTPREALDGFHAVKKSATRVGGAHARASVALTFGPFLMVW
jgi:hypothetical protein